MLFSWLHYWRYRQTWIHVARKGDAGWPVRAVATGAVHSACCYISEEFRTISAEMELAKAPGRASVLTAATSSDSDIARNKRDVWRWSLHKHEAALILYSTCYNAGLYCSATAVNRRRKPRGRHRRCAIAARLQTTLKGFNIVNGEHNRSENRVIGALVGPLLCLRQMLIHRQPA